MKIDLKELKRAVERIEKFGSLTEVTVNVDHQKRLMISYTEPMGGDNVLITLYDTESEKMGDITVTTRL